MRKITLLSFIAMCIMYVSCNKNSNELVPSPTTKTDEKQITYNGSNWLVAQVTQIIEIGDDSLKIMIKNPFNDTIKKLKLAIYFQKTDTYNEALNYKSILSVYRMLPNKDTTFYVYNRPDLPLDISQIFIKLISENKIIINNYIYPGMYDGQGAYYYGNDTINPLKYSSLKGIIEADGNYSFWVNPDNTETKITGKFIDTISIQNGFLSIGTNQFPISLDAFHRKHFDVTPSQIIFTTAVTPPQTSIEKKIKITLFRQP